MPVKKTKKIVKKPTQQKMVDFGTAITRFWTKYADFGGTAQRSEYWWAVLFLILVEVFLRVLYFLPLMDVAILLWTLVTFIPMLSVSARRLHDAGFSAKWLLVFWVGLLLSLLLAAFGNIFVLFAAVLWLVCFGVYVFLFVVSFLPSKFENNKYRK